MAAIGGKTYIAIGIIVAVASFLLKMKGYFLFLIAGIVFIGVGIFKLTLGKNQKTQEQKFSDHTKYPAPQKPQSQQQPSQHVQQYAPSHPQLASSHPQSAHPYHSRAYPQGIHSPIGGNQHRALHPAHHAVAQHHTAQYNPSHPAHYNAQNPPQNNPSHPASQHSSAQYHHARAHPGAQAAHPHQSVAHHAAAPHKQHLFHHPHAPVNPSGMPSKIFYCNRCGTVVHGFQGFCHKCGRKLR